MKIAVSTNERTALWIAASIFAVLGSVQLIRVLTHFAVIVGHHHIPIWISAIISIVAWLLALWFGYIAKHISHPSG